MNKENYWLSLARMLRTHYAHAEDWLRQPPPALPPGDDLLHILYDAAGPNRTILERHILAGWLLADKQDRTSSGRTSVLLDQVTARSGSFPENQRWTAVPIPVVQGNRGRIVYLLLGRADEGGSCTPAVEQPDHDEIRRTLTTLDSQGAYQYFFLLPPKHPKLTGSSMQLPLALAVLLFKQNKTWPSGIFATGALSPEKTIQPVSGLHEKRAAAGLFCRLFLYPAAQHRELENDPQSQACLDLDEAYFALSVALHPDDSGSRSHLLACRKDQHLFFNSFQKLPLFMIEHDPGKHFLDQARRDPANRLVELTPTFLTCSDPERSGYLARLYPIETLQELAERRAEHIYTIFDWVLKCMDHYNHQGDVEQCSRWAEFGATLLERVDMEAMLQFWNIRLVSQRFNRYDFRPHLPKQLSELLEKEKSHFAPRRSNRQLGALYGTLSQNYGFCGPVFLKETEKMAELAELAFGGRYRHETRRLLNYRIYARLDAGDRKTSRDLLGQYLELEPGSSPEQWLDQEYRDSGTTRHERAFMTALTLRFLADSGQHAEPKCLEKVLSGILEKTGHPWQLVTLNLGRLLSTAGCRQQAAQALSHSIQTSLAGGPSMRPMALLGLAELHRSDLGTREDETQVLQLAKWLKQSRVINRDHFQVICEQETAREILDTVLHDMPRLFPFSYR